MDIKIPESFRGKPIKGAMKRVLDKQTKQVPVQPTSQQSTPVVISANIKHEDYIQIPNTNLLISKFEPDKYKGLNWYETHEALAEDGLFMPSPAIFMPYFKNIVSANNGFNIWYDGNGKLINKNEIKDIYKHLTKDHINGGAYAWFDAKFDSGRIKTDHRIVKGHLQSQTYDLESHVSENCYVDLEFNSQGLPIKKSKDQDYEQGKNLYFWKPVEGRVAGFGADSDGADLDCNWDPDDRGDALGVFACCEAAQKSSGGSN